MSDFPAGFFAPWIIYAVMLGLHLLLPARRVAGYVTDAQTAKPVTYRLNGLLVLAVVAVLWVVLGVTGALPWDWLYTHRWASLAGSCTLGLAFSFAMVLAAPSGGKPFLLELYKGRLENPQFFGGRVDAKMFLYLVGAAMLGLNLLATITDYAIVGGTGLQKVAQSCHANTRSLVGKLTAMVANLAPQKRRYLASGAPDGDELRLDAWPYGFFVIQENPAVAVTYQGDVVAAWESNDSLNGDDPDVCVEGREHHGDGSWSEQFQVNTSLAGSQRAAVIGANESGTYVVAWHDPSGVWARRFVVAVFFDGFESGDTSGWIVPCVRFPSSTSLRRWRSST